MDTLITVSIRNVYGEQRIYPLNALATKLARLAGTKTLTRSTLEIARAMGFNIQLEPDINPDEIGVTA